MFEKTQLSTTETPLSLFDHNFTIYADVDIVFNDTYETCDLLGFTPDNFLCGHQRRPSDNGGDDAGGNMYICTMKSSRKGWAGGTKKLRACRAI